MIHQKNTFIGCSGYQTPEHDTIKVYHSDLRRKKRKLPLMKYSPLIPSLLLVATILLCWPCTAQNTPDTYTNPVIAGDFPDPSIVRVGNTYYAVGTSCDFAPNYPIYQSSDLINWTRVGAVFSKPPAWASDDFWAPELFYRDGTFYVYYTTKRKDTRIACIGVATTQDIHSGFTDHGIIVEWGEEAIDAFIFDDDDGKRYFTWKAYGLTEGRDIEILASELSDDGLRLVGDHWTLTDHTQGWQGAGDEGQCLVKRNGYYYLLYSIGGCCDNRCDYRVVVSRSKDLRSGWEQYPEPILQGGDDWRCPGHGTLVTTADNRDFYLYHSYNATDFEFIGRQGMLDEIVWDELSGWPRFKNGRTPSTTAPVPFQGTEQHKEVNWSDDFSSDEHLAFWEWDVNVPAPQPTVEEGDLVMATTHRGINFLGLRPKTGDYSLVAEVALDDGDRGVGVYSNQENVLAFMASSSELSVIKIEKGQEETLWKEAVKQARSVFLKYEAVEGRYYRFFWSTDGQDWKPVALPNNTVDATYIAQWGYSPRAGFIADGALSVPPRYSSVDITYQYK